MRDGLGLDISTFNSLCHLLYHLPESCSACVVVHHVARRNVAGLRSQ